MHIIVDRETSECFLLVLARALMTRLLQPGNKPRETEGPQVYEFKNPRTGKTIYMEDRTDPERVDAQGLVYSSDFDEGGNIGCSCEDIDGVDTINEDVALDGNRLRVIEEGETVKNTHAGVATTFG